MHPKHHCGNQSHGHRCRKECLVLLHRCERVVDPHCYRCQAVPLDRGERRRRKVEAGQGQGWGEKNVGSCEEGGSSKGKDCEGSVRGHSVRCHRGGWSCSGEVELLPHRILPAIGDLLADRFLGSDNTNRWLQRCPKTPSGLTCVSIRRPLLGTFWRRIRTASIPATRFPTTFISDRQYCRSIVDSHRHAVAVLLNCQAMYENNGLFRPQPAPYSQSVLLLVTSPCHRVQELALIFSDNLE